MTGFGRGILEKNQRSYSIEIKSVNHKYSDISIKIPRAISYLEENVKQELSKVISRGKVEVSIALENNSNIGREVKLNMELAIEYIKQLKKLCQATGIEENINVVEIAKLPEILSIQNNEQDDTISEELMECLQKAIQEFLNMRKKEGVAIAKDLQKRIINIQEEISKISEYSTGLVEEYVVKLKERTKEMLKTDIIDEARLAQEIVLFADKSSIEEEITRLKSHTEQFTELLEENAPTGKKLDFLIQEMNREINTIGSKANCLNITNLVIEIKSEIENLREQIQNVE